MTRLFGINAHVAVTAISDSSCQRLGPGMVPPRMRRGPFGIQGGTRMDKQMKTKPCPECDGDGVLDRGTADEQQCPTCGGTGVVADDDDDKEDVLNTGPEVQQKGAAK